MATRPKAVIESRNGEKFSPITIAKNVLTDDGQNLHDILSDRKEDMMTPTIVNSSSMFKVGQGDNVDYSSNVVNGAYESCVLKGRSLVNLINFSNSSGSANANKNGDTLTITATNNDAWSAQSFELNGMSHDKTYIACWDNLTFTHSYEDGKRSVVGIYASDDEGKQVVIAEINRNQSFNYLIFTLPSKVPPSKKVYFRIHATTWEGELGATTTIKGAKVLEYIEDMENWNIPYFEGLCDVKSPILSNVGKNLFDNVFTVGGWWNGVADSNAKQFMRSVNLTPVKPNTTYAYDSTVKGHRQKANFMAHDADGNFIEYLGFGRTFTTPSNCHYIHLYTENDNSLIAQIEEGAVSTTIEPYKSNILSANGDKIELTEDMFEQGAIAQYINSQNIGKTYQWMKDKSDPNYDKRRLRLKNLVKVKPNTKLILQNTDNFMYAMCGFDSNKLNLGTFDTSWIQNTTITIPQDVHYISFFIRKKDDTAITINDFKNTKFTLSEVDKTIVLRSLPNGVCDTLNVETGEYVQKIGEVVLNGNNNESWDVFTGREGLKYFRIPCPKMVENNREQETPKFLIADKINFNTYSYLYQSTSIPEDMVGGTTKSSALGVQCIYVYYKNINVVNTFKQYLQQNPITVQYELATPIVSTVDIQGFPFSYKNGHVQLSSGSIEQSLTPKVEYSVATNRNGQIRSNQKMVERHQKQLDRLQAMILTNLVNTQYEQTLTNLKYDLKNVREEVK